MPRIDGGDGLFAFVGRSSDPLRPILIQAGIDGSSSAALFAEEEALAFADAIREVVEGQVCGKAETPEPAPEEGLCAVCKLPLNANQHECYLCGETVCFACCWTVPFGGHARTLCKRCLKNTGLWDEEERRPKGAEEPPPALPTDDEIAAMNVRQLCKWLLSNAQESDWLRTGLGGGAGVLRSGCRGTRNRLAKARAEEVRAAENAQWSEPVGEMDAGDICTAAISLGYRIVPARMGCSVWHGMWCRYGVEGGVWNPTIADAPGPTGALRLALKEVAALLGKYGADTDRIWFGPLEDMPEGGPDTNTKEDDHAE